jgi:hypothetical protein
VSLTTRRLVLIGLALLITLRSAVFVFAGASHFDSDQAVTGLMAKHLSELRAFPVFWYGQTYMLAVEAWLAAPVMAIIGATVTALKLPLLAINAAVVVLLFQSLMDDVGLGPWRAGLASLFFALAAPITSAHYLTANGGNVEPCLYVLLLWRLRRQPGWFGLVLGIGFLNREFTIYGVVALVLLDALGGTLFRGEAARRYAGAFLTAAATWLAVLILQHYSSAAGPGTSTADLSVNLAANNLLQVAERICFDGRAVVSGAGQIFTIHWPELFGLERQPLSDFGIESSASQGATGAAWLLVPVVAIPILGLLASSPGFRAAHRSGAGPPMGAADAGRTLASVVDPRSAGTGFCAYLIVVALLSVAGYLVGRCGLIDFHTMRYELLSPLGAAGLAGAFLGRPQPRALLALWTSCTAAVFVISLTSHVRLIAEYLTRRPTPAKLELAYALDARGVRYAYADYWTAYYVTFMTRERIIVASDSIVKVRTHNRIVDTHRAEAIRIARNACPGGRPLTPAFWSCPPW